MNIKVNIGEDVLDSAKFVACKVDDTYLRKRVYALGIAANATAKYLTENGLKTLSNHSLYKSAVFAKEIEIADIYANNARFDVRVTFNNTTFTVPKLHVKYDIKPEAYIVVRFDNSLKEIEFLGFIPEKELKYEKNGEEYYTYPLDILKPFDEFISYAEALKITPKKYSQEEHENILALCVSMIDEQAAEADKIYFIKHVADCTVCRDTFCDINDFDDILSQLKNYHELLNDSTLSVLSGNKEEVDQAAIAHMALVEKASEDFPRPSKKVDTPAAVPPVAKTVIAGAAAGSVLAAAESSKISDGVLSPEGVNAEEQAFAADTKEGESGGSDSEKTSAEPEKLVEESVEDDLLLLDDNDGSSILELPEESNDEDILQITEIDDISNNEVSEKEVEQQPAIEEVSSEDSFDELNASIDAFASEPVEEPFKLEEDEETLTETEDLQIAADDVTEEPAVAQQTSDELRADDDMLIEEDSLEEISSDDISLDLDGLEPLAVEDSLEEISSDDISLDLDGLEPLAVEDSADETPAVVDEISQDENIKTDTAESLDTLQLETLSEDDAAIPEISLDDNDLGNIDDIGELEEVGELEEISAEPESVKEQPEENVVASTPLRSAVQEQEEPAMPENDEISNLNGSDLLELEDLETLDTIEPSQEPEKENTKTDSLMQNINITDTVMAYDSKFAIESDKEDWPASSQPQEPVELKYDDLEVEADESEKIEEDNKAAAIDADVFELNKQEPVIESFEDETEQHVADFDFPDYNYENLESDSEKAEPQPEIALSQNEPEEQIPSPQKVEDEVEQSKSANSDDEDLQELLDDDLLGLLSDEDDDTDDYQNKEDEADYEPFAGESDETPAKDEGEEFVPDSDENLEAAENGEIENLFDEQSAPQEGEQVELDLSQEPMSAEAVKKTKKLAIAGALIALLAIGGAAGGYYMYQKNIAAANNDSVDTAQDNQVFDFQNNAAGQSEEDTTSGAVSQDINKSMTNSFSDKPAAISITKLSWQVSEKLAVEPSVKEYLQTAGKNIQLNLQNDLANASDVAFNNSVKVTFEIAPDNTMKGIQVLESSGSDKIDAIITKSIKNTLKYVSVPKLKNYNSDYFLTLIINF